MPKSTLSAVALLTLLISGAADAKTHKFPNARIQVDIPDTWKVELKDDVLNAEAPGNDDVGLILWEAGEADSLDVITNELDKELGKIIKDAKEDEEPTVGELNGLTAAFVDGKGKIENVAVEYSVGVVQNGKQHVIVLGFADAKLAKKYEPALEKMLKSVKASTPAPAAAKAYKFPKARIQIEIPDGWKVDVQDEMLSAEGPGDDDVGLFLWDAGKADSLEVITKELDKELAKIVKDSTTDGEPTQAKVNGLDMAFVDGKGKVEGLAVRWSVGVVKNGKQHVIVLAFADAKVAQKYDAIWEVMLKSIKKI